MPYTCAMGDGLFEIRAKGQEGIGRALFSTVVGKRIFILHGFIKKTEQTPQRALDTARRRMKEVRPRAKYNPVAFDPRTFAGSGQARPGIP